MELTSDIQWYNGQWAIHFAISNSECEKDIFSAHDTKGNMLLSMVLTKNKPTVLTNERYLSNIIHMRGCRASDYVTGNF